MSDRAWPPLGYRLPRPIDLLVWCGAVLYD